MYAPVSGEVVEVNSALADEPATVNKSPYQDGWFAKIKLSNKKEVSGGVTGGWLARAAAPI